jgi:beta-lactamase class A
MVMKTVLAVSVVAAFAGCCSLKVNRMRDYCVDYGTLNDPVLQVKVEAIDASLRAKYGMTSEQSAVGVMDLRTGRLAMIHPDRGEYAASVAKVAILLAYFELHPASVEKVDPGVRHELGLMIKASSNEMATKYSRAMGLKQIQGVLNAYGFYDRAHGGIWMGKHYGPSSERIGDPLNDHSHAATVRQLVRFYLMLEQGKLVSAQASKVMREIFASSDIPHDEIKFVKGLAGREVELLRKWGSWKDWLHDSAIISGPGRRYILVALTHHAKGDEYLENLAREVDDLMSVDDVTSTPP